MPLPRFARLSEERRLAILQAALGEFAEHGYAGASFNRIIAELGTSKGAIYYYFSDKEDLYLTVLEWVFSLMGREIHSPEQATDADAFWREITRVYHSLIDVLLRDSRIIRMAQKSAAELERFAHSGRLAPLLEGVAAETARLVAEGQRVGAVRTDVPIETLTQLVLSIGQVLDRHMLEHRRLDRSKDRDEAVHFGVDVIRRVLEPRPGGVPSKRRPPRARS